MRTNFICWIRSNSWLSPSLKLCSVYACSEQIGDLIWKIKEVTWKELEYEVVNNTDFYTDLPYTEFLRTVGKYITVNQMMKKDTVKNRLQWDDKFISYTEFSYMLMQGHDYLQLFNDKWCNLQIWASDQRGNIVTWVELIRKVGNGEAYAATCPLLTDSTWRKFGKSEWNAIWLNPSKNSPYICYNYFMNSWDEDISRYLLTFTLLTNEEVQEIVEEHQKEPHLRKGQARLAYEVTKMVFGENMAELCFKIKNILFWSEPMKEIEKLSEFEKAWFNFATWWYLVNSPENKLIDLLVGSWLYSSNWEAKKAIKAQAVSLNENKITDIGYVLSENDYVNWLALLRKGKKNYATVLLSK